MTHQVVTVVENRKAAHDMKELVVSWPGTSPRPVPGQFLTIRAAAGTDPLLRRPFAFSMFEPAGCGSARGTAGIVFQKRGKATELLCAMEAGDTVDIIGPLGTAFPSPAADRLPVLLAGGIGIGPILYLAQHLAEQKPFAAGKPILILGARTSGFLPEAYLVERLGLESSSIRICTDDGSAGLKGTVVDAFRTLSDEERSRAELFACGPTPMLRAVHAAAEDNRAPCWVSMEQMMACAVGACLGCVIAVKSEKKYARVCTEGPVFDSSLIDWSTP